MLTIHALFVALAALTSSPEVPAAPVTIAESAIDLDGDGREDRIRIDMVSGREYHDTAMWAGRGRKYEGQFAVIVEFAGREAVTTPLNDFLCENTKDNMFFMQGEWEIHFQDYNGDGRPDFNLGQYACSRGWEYKPFTVSDEGEVEELPINRNGSDSLLIKDSRGRKNSAGDIRVEEGSISHTYYSNEWGALYRAWYAWNKEEKAFVFQKEAIAKDE